jgi:GR25 family glycosyltransferase involved in LPS biosynthesis
MIPIYWINLDESVDRRNIMFSQCKQNKLLNKRIQAIRHEKPTIGVCLSHLRAIHTAWLEENDLALICEDDVDLVKGQDLMKIVQTILESVPNNIQNDWDIIQLQYTDPMFTKVLGEYLITQDKKQNKLIKGYFMGCVAYLINRKGMNKLLSQMTVIDEKDFAKYRVTALLDHPMAICEELVYRYVNTYISTFPVFSYFENQSTVNNDPKYFAANKINKMNLDTIKSILNIDDYKILQEKDFALDYHLHWFAGDKQLATDNLVKIFNIKDESCNLK